MTPKVDGLKTVVLAFGFLVFLTLSVVAHPVLDVVRDVERNLDARVGFYMQDLQTGEVVAYAADDRFPMNSTFKLLACGALLDRVQGAQAQLSDRVSLQGVTIETYSPAMKKHIQQGHTDLSLGDACGMMLSVSDNTATNLVLAEIGGPRGMTAYLRSIGDQVTRLDRWEPEMSQSTPGDVRDTTTPRAIAQSVQRIVIGDALSDASQQVLGGWLAEHSVADALFRAALPPDWSIDDRTGAGGYGSRSIVAVMYPPGRKPVVASLFMTETDGDIHSRNAAAAKVGAAIVAHVANP